MTFAQTLPSHLSLFSLLNKITLFLSFLLYSIYKTCNLSPNLEILSISISEPIGGKRKITIRISKLKAEKYSKARLEKNKGRILVGPRAAK